MASNSTRLTQPIGPRGAPAQRRWTVPLMVLYTRFGAGLAAAVLLLCTPGSSQAAGTLPLAELAKPGRVLMLRHAQAPGTGDPPSFKLGDCSTQRNLDAVGRAQAGRLGELLAQAGVVHAKVYSSQWCRCLETARQLRLGPVACQAASVRAGSRKGVLSNG